MDTHRAAYLIMLVLAVQLLGSSTYKQMRLLTRTGFSVGKRPSCTRADREEDPVRKSFVPFTKLIDSSKISGNWTFAIRAAEEALHSLTPSIATGVIRVFGESGDLGRAIGVLSEMKKQGISPNERHYGVLIQCCKLTGQWDMAMELFHLMKSQSVPRSTVLCNILLSTVAKSNQGRYIEEILSSMREDRIAMDTISYSSAIFAFGKCNQPKDSLRLWEQLLTSNTVMPNTILVNNVLHACNAARMWEQCTEVFDKALEIGVDIDAITISNCIIARAECFDFDGAQRYFNMTRDSHPTVRRDVGLYNAIVLACERTRRSVEARSYISQMRAEGIEPDHKTYSSAISCCGKAGDAIGGLELIQEMKSRGIKLDAAVFYAAIEAMTSTSTSTSNSGNNIFTIAKNIDSLPAYPNTNLTRLSLYSDAVNEGVLTPWHVNSSVSTIMNIKCMDLHGYPVSVGKTAIDFVLQEMKNSNEIFSLEIITGKGNHVNSSGTRGVLRIEIEDYLKRLQPSGILVTDQSNDNRGTIVVTKESIKAWFDAIDSMLK